MKWVGVHLLALYSRTLFAHHPENHFIENKSGATAFYLGFKRNILLALLIDIGQFQGKRKNKSY